MKDKSLELLSRDEIPRRFPWYAPRWDAHPIPSAAWDSPPFACLEVNAEWSSHIRGLLEVLQWPDAWEGTDEERQAAADAAIAIEDAFRMCPSCCETTSQRINEHYALMVEQAYDGTLESVAPGAPDTTYSYDSGDDTEAKILARRSALCAAVNRWVRSCFETEAAAIRRTGQLVSLIAGAILGPFAFVPGIIAFGVFGAISEIYAQAFEDEGAIQNVICCMYGHLMNLPVTRESFQGSPGDCGFSFPDNSAQLAGCVARYAQGLENWLAFCRILRAEYEQALRGEYEPELCTCYGECLGEDDWENDGRLGWYLEPTMPYGHWESGVGWVTDAQPSGYHYVDARRACAEGTPINKASVALTWYGPNGTGNAIWFMILDDVGELVYESAKAVNNGLQVVVFTFPTYTAYTVAWQMRGYTGDHNNKMELHRSNLELV